MLIGYENKALRKMYGPKLDEVTGEWRRLRNEMPHNLYRKLFG